MNLRYPIQPFPPGYPYYYGAPTYPNYAPMQEFVPGTQYVRIIPYPTAPMFPYDPMVYVAPPVPALPPWTRFPGMMPNGAPQRLLQPGFNNPPANLQRVRPSYLRRTAAAVPDVGGNFEVPNLQKETTAKEGWCQNSYMPAKQRRDLDLQTEARASISIIRQRAKMQKRRRRKRWREEHATEDAADSGELSSIVVEETRGNINTECSKAANVEADYESCDDDQIVERACAGREIRVSFAVGKCRENGNLSAALDYTSIGDKSDLLSCSSESEASNIYPGDFGKSACQGDAADLWRRSLRNATISKAYASSACMSTPFNSPAAFFLDSLVNERRRSIGVAAADYWANIDGLQESFWDTSSRALPNIYTREEDHKPNENPGHGNAVELAHRVCGAQVPVPAHNAVASIPNVPTRQFTSELWWDMTTDAGFATQDYATSPALREGNELLYSRPETGHTAGKEDDAPGERSEEYVVVEYDVNQNISISKRKDVADAGAKDQNVAKNDTHAGRRLLSVDWESICHVRGDLSPEGYVVAQLADTPSISDLDNAIVEHGPQLPIGRPELAVATGPARQTTETPQLCSEAFVVGIPVTDPTGDMQGTELQCDSLEGDDATSQALPGSNSPKGSSKQSPRGRTTECRATSRRLYRSASYPRRKTRNRSYRWWSVYCLQGQSAEMPFERDLQTWSRSQRNDAPPVNGIHACEAKATSKSAVDEGGTAGRSPKRLHIPVLDFSPVSKVVETSPPATVPVLGAQTESQALTATCEARNRTTEENKRIYNDSKPPTKSENVSPDLHNQLAQADLNENHVTAESKSHSPSSLSVSSNVAEHAVGGKPPRAVPLKLRGAKGQKCFTPRYPKTRTRKPRTKVRATNEQMNLSKNSAKSHVESGGSDASRSYDSSQCLWATITLPDPVTVNLVNFNKSGTRKRRQTIAKMPRSNSLFLQPILAVDEQLPAYSLSLGAPQVKGTGSRAVGVAHTLHAQRNEMTGLLHLPVCFAGGNFSMLPGLSKTLNLSGQRPMPKRVRSLSYPRYASMSRRPRVRAFKAPANVPKKPIRFRQRLGDQRSIPTSKTKLAQTSRVNAKIASLQVKAATQDPQKSLSEEPSVTKIPISASTGRIAQDTIREDTLNNKTSDTGESRSFAAVANVRCESGEKDKFFGKSNSSKTSGKKMKRSFLKRLMPVNIGRKKPEKKAGLVVSDKSSEKVAKRFSLNKNTKPDSDSASAKSEGPDIVHEAKRAVEERATRNEDVFRPGTSEKLVEQRQPEKEYVAHDKKTQSRSVKTALYRPTLVCMAATECSNTDLASLHLTQARMEGTEHRDKALRTSPPKAIRRPRASVCTPGVRINSETGDMLDSGDVKSRESFLSSTTIGDVPEAAGRQFGSIRL